MLFAALAKDDHVKLGPDKAAPTQQRLAPTVLQDMSCTAQSHCTRHANVPLPTQRGSLPGAGGIRNPAAQGQTVLAMLRVSVMVSVCGCDALTKSFPGEVLLPNCVMGREGGGRSARTGTVLNVWKR